MRAKRRTYSADFKARVALEAVKGLKTINELEVEHGVHPVQVSQWKRPLQEEVREVFATRRSQAVRDEQAREAALYEEIGRLKVELDWLKKKVSASVEDKRQGIELGHPELSIRRQCELLGLSRASDYYLPATESEENLRLMRMLGRITRLPREI
jgi:putative transposase